MSQNQKRWRSGGGGGKRRRRGRGRPNPDFIPEIEGPTETVTGVLDVVAPGVMHGTHYFKLYYPDADANGDGFPDEGVPPACVFQLNTVDTRLPMP